MDAMSSGPRESLEPDIATLLADSAEKAIQYVAGIDKREVAPRISALARLDELHEPFPEAPTAPEKVLAQLHEIGSPSTACSGPRRSKWLSGRKCTRRSPKR